VTSVTVERLVCRWCGRCERVTGLAGDERCLAPAPPAGFTVDHAEVVFLGLCPACQQAPVRISER
jgi:Fur family transcriptional regulator, stress-responsive regulator